MTPEFTMDLPLLLPGTLCDATLWANVALPMGAKVLGTVRGDSLADAASRALKAAPNGEKVHLVGFSLGAIVACEVLRRAPERVARLTLISANARPPTSLQRKGWAGHEQQVRAGRFEEVIATLAEAAGPRRQLVLDMARRMGPDVYLEQLELLRSRPDSRPTIAGYGGSLTLLVGQEDRVAPPHLAEELKSLVPQATVRVIPGAGHYLPLDAPRAVSDAVRELARA